jgi:hypothetical protein
VPYISCRQIWVVRGFRVCGYRKSSDLRLEENRVRFFDLPSFETGRAGWRIPEIIRLETGEEYRRGSSPWHWIRDRRMLIVLRSEAGEDLLRVLRPDRRSLTGTHSRTGGIGWRELKVIRMLKGSCRFPSPHQGFPNPSDPGAKKPTGFFDLQR